MTRPEWEPLTTAEAVVAARDAGRQVEWTWMGQGDDEIWIEPMHLEFADVSLVKFYFTIGERYRARIEGGAE